MADPRTKTATLGQFTLSFFAGWLYLGKSFKLMFRGQAHRLPAMKSHRCGTKPGHSLRMALSVGIAELGPSNIFERAVKLSPEKVPGLSPQELQRVPVVAIRTSK